IFQHPGEHANVTLIQVGLLGCSPIDPYVEITLDCLELYHQICCWQSSFSLQAMAKVLCRLHNATFSNTFCNQLSIVFDIYLDIQCGIQEVIDDALGQRSPNWHLLNACPPCSYKLQGESKLTPECMQAMDGNSLLKHVEAMGHADTCVFESDYFSSPSDIDRFKDDVKNHPGTIKATTLVNKEDPPLHGFEQTVCTVLRTGLLLIQFL
ncbi:hypothetical protein K439DRAFT_1370801, partial [Ramaria rubella]